ncbi:cytochrome-c peroxidase [Sedimenticola sp.]|uniref:cytochrome-c peroxidase n=1 Tax=Sedimenticola sp. TaxID=1940285 RepID=UPI003D0A470B
MVIQILRGLLFAVGLLVSIPLVQADGHLTRDEPILPLPSHIELDSRKVHLGNILYHDVRLSADDTISCAHCHNLETNGSDGQPRSKGIGGAVGDIKAPTVYNSGFNFVQFWNGRAASLEEQIGGPINNPIEMGSSWPQVLAKLNADPAMVSAFSQIYQDGITEQNIRDAIATFERSLITANSPFDRWLLGDETAISELELNGYLLFKDYGCTSCHQGKNVGGNMYGYMGAIGNYFSDRGDELTQADLGRYQVSGIDDDRHLFKVPSLRLAALQKFFFHDASVSKLEEAIQIMGRYQLGRKIPNEDVSAIAAFLKSLVGTHPQLVKP